MRNFTRLLAAALFCGALFSAAFVGAQDATSTPTAEATAEVTTAPTVETTVEATTEVTMEATSEVTAAATTAPASAATTAPTATLMPAATNSTTTTTNTQSNGLVVCDSDLILSLYFAEHYFGFDGVMTNMINVSTNNSSMVDVAKLDKGQYAELFVAPMTSTPITMMTQDQMQAAARLMAMDNTAMMNQMATMMPPGTSVSSLTVLNPISIPSEDRACTNLRSELNRFYTIVAFQGMQTSMGNTPEATAAVGTGSTSSNVNFSTTMTGAKEVPPADPDGTGTAAITVDMANTQVCYTLTVQNIGLPATAAHIHRGAVGVSGPPVVTFTLLPDASGTSASCVKTDPALLQEIANNPENFYVNVHNAEFPNGAVRGQLNGQ